MPKILLNSTNDRNCLENSVLKFRSWLDQPLTTKSDVKFDSITVNDLTANGNVIFTGTVSEFNTDVIEIKNNVIKINDENAHPLQYGGIQVERGPGLIPYDIFYNEEEKRMRVGMDGNTLPVVVMSDDGKKNGGIAVWNSDSDCFYATSNVQSDLTVNNVDVNGSMNISGKITSDIIIDGGINVLNDVKTSNVQTECITSNYGLKLDVGDITMDPGSRLVWKDTVIMNSSGISCVDDLNVNAEHVNISDSCVIAHGNGATFSHNNSNEYVIEALTNDLRLSAASGKVKSNNLTIGGGIVTMDIDTVNGNASFVTTNGFEFDSSLKIFDIGKNTKLCFGSSSSYISSSSISGDIEIVNESGFISIPSTLNVGGIITNPSKIYLTTPETIISSVLSLSDNSRTIRAKDSDSLIISAPSTIYLSAPTTMIPSVSFGDPSATISTDSTTNYMKISSPTGISIISPYVNVQEKIMYGSSGSYVGTTSDGHLEIFGTNGIICASPITMSYSTSLNDLTVSSFISCKNTIIGGPFSPINITSDNANSICFNTSTEQQNMYSVGRSERNMVFTVPDYVGSYGVGDLPSFTFTTSTGTNILNLNETTVNVVAKKFNVSNSVNITDDVCLIDVPTVFSKNAVFSNGVVVNDPILPTDITTKKYVDSVVTGMSVKSPVQVASVSNIDISSLQQQQSFDLTLVAGYRVLLKDQIDETENGIYVYDDSGHLSRASDMNTGDEIKTSIYVYVESGGAKYGATGFTTTTINWVVGTDKITFTPFSGPSSGIVMGDGLVRDGNEISVKTDSFSTTIDESTGNVKIPSTFFSTGLSGGSSSTPLSTSSNQSHVNSVGVLTNGTWNANVVGVQYGGTGCSSFNRNSIVVGNNNKLSSYSSFVFDGVNLGIGTSNPQFPLHISTNSSSVSSVIQSETNMMMITVNETDSSITTNGKLVMTISDTGMTMNVPIVSPNIIGTLNVSNIGNCIELQNSTTTFTGPVIFNDNISSIQTDFISSSGDTLSINNNAMMVVGKKDGVVVVNNYERSVEGNRCCATLSTIGWYYIGCIETGKIIIVVDSEMSLIIENGVVQTFEIHNDTRTVFAYIYVYSGNHYLFVRNSDVATIRFTLSPIVIPSNYEGTTALPDGTTSGFDLNTWTKTFDSSSDDVVVTGRFKTLTVHGTSNFEDVVTTPSISVSNEFNAPSFSCNSSGFNALNVRSSVAEGLTIDDVPINLNLNKITNTDDGEFILSVKSGAEINVGNDIKISIDNETVHVRETVVVDEVVQLNGNANVAGTLHINGDVVIEGKTSLGLNHVTVSGVADPVNDDDAATKHYVDDMVQGITIETSVVVATKVEVNVSERFTVIDGVVLEIGDVVLVKNQTNLVENGTYVNDVVPVKTTNIKNGGYVYVVSGTMNGGTGWICKSDNSFMQFSGPGEISVGEGLTKNGRGISVNLDGGSLEFAPGSSAIRVNSNLAGTGLFGGGDFPLSVSSIKHLSDLGTIITGTWNADIVEMKYGGTGTSSVSSTRIPYSNGTNLTEGRLVFSNNKLGVNTLNPSSGITIYDDDIAIVRDDQKPCRLLMNDLSICYDGVDLSVVTTSSSSSSLLTIDKISGMMISGITVDNLTLSDYVKLTTSDVRVFGSSGSTKLSLLSGDNSACYCQIYGGLGNIDNVTDNEMLRYGFYNGRFVIQTSANGSGQNRPLYLYSGNSNVGQFVLTSDGNASFNGNVKINSSLDVASSSTFENNVTFYQNVLFGSSCSFTNGATSYSVNVSSTTSELCIGEALSVTNDHVSVMGNLIIGSNSIKTITSPLSLISSKVEISGPVTMDTNLIICNGTMLNGEKISTTEGEFDDLVSCKDLETSGYVSIGSGSCEITSSWTTSTDISTMSGIIHVYGKDTTSMLELSLIAGTVSVTSDITFASNVIAKHVTIDDVVVTGGITLSNWVISSSTTGELTISDSIILSSSQLKINVPLTVGNIILTDNTINVNSGRIINVPIPTIGTDCANKMYVDNLAKGLNLKESVIAASTVNINLFYPVTSIDGINIESGLRYLLKRQTNSIENGIYTATDSLMLIRADDYMIDTHAAGTFTFIQKGLTHAETGWVCVSDYPNDVVGTDPIGFTQFNGNIISAGNGLYKDGNNVMNIELAAVSGLTLTSGGGLSLDPDAFSSSSGGVIWKDGKVVLDSVLTSNTSWHANVIDVLYGGTGTSSFSEKNGLVFFDGTRLDSTNTLTFDSISGSLSMGNDWTVSRTKETTTTTTSYGLPYLTSGKAAISWDYVTISGNTCVAMAEPDSTNGSDVYLSTDGGFTWTEILDELNNTFEETSISNLNILMCSPQNYLYVSNDGGKTFNAQMTDMERMWEWCSVNDKYMLASSFGDGVWKSSDSGSSWTIVSETPTTVTDVGFVHVTKNGLVQFIGYFGGYLFVSNDYGSTFTRLSTIRSGNYFNMVESTTTTLVMYEQPGSLFVSTNLGTTWTESISQPSRKWTGASVSNDGTIIVACADQSFVFLSNDSGSTFTNIIDSVPRSWTFAVVSGDGKYVFCGGDNVNVYDVETSTNTIVSTNHTKAAASTANSGLLYIPNGSVALIYDPYGSSSLSVSCARSGNVLTFNDFGKIGIGEMTTTPTHTLDVNGSFRCTGDVVLDDPLSVSSGGTGTVFSPLGNDDGVVYLNGETMKTVSGTGVLVNNNSGFEFQSGTTLKTTLGLTIGTNVQAWSANLDSISGLAPSVNAVPVGNGQTFGQKTLGSLAFASYRTIDNAHIISLDDSTRDFTCVISPDQNTTSLDFKLPERIAVFSSPYDVFFMSAYPSSVVVTCVTNDTAVHVEWTENLSRVFVHIRYSI